MELILTRTEKEKSFTGGCLYIDNTLLCHTLEPTWRDVGWGRPGKIVRGYTAIPDGQYPVVITYSPKFKKWLPLLLHVPKFEGIRIHAGNTPEDTSGCILVGERSEPGKLLNSTQCLQRVKDRIVEAKERGEGVWICIE